MYRSSHQGCSLKKVFLKHFTKCTGKQIYWNLFFNYFLIKIQTLGLQLYWKRDSNKGVFLWILWNFKNTFFTEHFLVTSPFCNSSHSFVLHSFICSYHLLFKKTQKLTVLPFFLFFKYICYIVLMYFIVQKKSCFVNEIVKLCFKIKVQNCNYKHKKQILKNNQKRKNKQNEKVGNQKLGKVGNLKKIILSFFISEFLISL